MTDAATTSVIRIGLVQMRCTCDPRANLDHALEMTRSAADRGARLVCLPELFRTPYFCQSEDPAVFRLAEPIPGPTTEAFEALARELDIAVIVSVFELRAPGLYHNSLAVVDGERGLVGSYRKMHIPDDPRYYEKYYFTPGDLGFRAFTVRQVSIGTLICWDQWYPEAARLTALRGAQILFYPTAIGWHPEDKGELGERQREAWRTTQRAHAIANGCFVAAVNRIGFEPDPASGAGGGGIEFWGSSFMAAPDGHVLACAGQDAEEVLVVDADLAEIAAFRHGWPFFRDRRIDAYEGLTLRFIDE